MKQGINLFNIMISLNKNLEMPKFIFNLTTHAFGEIIIILSTVDDSKLNSKINAGLI